MKGSYFGGIRRRTQPAFDIDADEADDDSDRQNHEARIAAYEVGQNRQKGHLSTRDRKGKEMLDNEMATGLVRKRNTHIPMFISVEV